MTLLTLLFACQTVAAPPPSPFWDHHEARVVGEPSGETCTVVAVHGRGSNPESFAGLFEDLDFDLQVVLPRAPEAYGPKGWTWYPSVRGDRKLLADALDARADALAEALPSIPVGHPVRGKPIITGFSQGGMLSWAVAARHPEAIRGALPLSGFMPVPSLERVERKKRTAPIAAFHGELDSVISLMEAERTAEALKARGFDVTLKRYPNTSHTVPRAVRDDWVAALRKLCGP